MNINPGNLIFTQSKSILNFLNCKNSESAFNKFLIKLRNCRKLDCILIEQQDLKNYIT